MTEALDPRLHPVREDLAGAELKGRVAAPRFVEPRAAQVAVGTADQRAAPSREAMVTNQLLYGDEVRVYETAGGWAWVQNRADGYVGYVEAGALRGTLVEPDHWVRVPRTFVFSAPHEKAPTLEALPMTARVRLAGEQGAYRELAGGGWVPARHLAPLGERAEDYVATALAFIGAPYLWGGRTWLGFDCSGLVQLALTAAGLPCPRDSDMQEAAVGEARPLDEAPRRGDLLFMPGHGVIALDAWRVVHANAHEMMVSVEPLEDLVARVTAREGRGLTAVRRPVPAEAAAPQGVK